MRSYPHRMMPIIFFLCASYSFAQSWSPVDPQNIIPMGKRDIIPQEYVIYQMDYQLMKTKLWSAPYEYAQSLMSSNTIITVGLADGSADMFRIVQYDMMEAPLAAQYTDIKTFRGVSISNPYRVIRADWTKNGFRAVISDLDGKTYIDPYQRNDMANRLVYYAKTYSREIDWICGTEGADFNGGTHHEQRIVGVCEFRSYRLAVATTGEYSNYFGAMSSSQSALVMAQVVTAVNRVNDVYETDFSTRLILIGNNSSIFYYDSGADPYSGDACTQLGQNQTTITDVIGSANYDIGHVFSVGSGGCAGLGVLCSSGNKARGATGLNPPTGDPFYIDYVAHELGHQFGGNHTQNNNCNRNAATAMEPGSASTIMGYAGICSPDVQGNSDAYMHGISLQEIAAEISSTSCEAIISTANSAPVVSNVPNYTIPISTPFVLTASATDADNNPLTYCWEQWDPEVGAAMPPVSTNQFGPLFRSLLPTSSPTRYFPNITSIINGTNPTWEELPSITRDMEFRVTVRDLYDGIWGCTDEDNTMISVTATSGPFTVSSQNSATTWPEGSTQTITWNVANTTAAPVSCANVDIRLSTDGGLTYPTMLLQNTPNDGSASVMIPTGVTTTGRIMIRGSNNIFFDINNANITIEQALPNFTINLNPKTVSECNDGAVQTTVEVGQIFGFTDPVSLSVINKPPGSIVTFNPQIVMPGSNSTLTISNLTGLFGTYTPLVRATSTTGIKDSVFTINLLEPPTIAPTLLSPGNNSIDAVITPLLDWQTLAGATQYEYQLAYDNLFANLVTSGTTSIDKIQITAPLIVGQQYYWRVKGINTCGNGVWSSAFTFTTVSCLALMSTNVPINIPSSGAPIVTSIFDCPLDMVITDINIINLTGTHSWVDDLKFSIIAPDASERLIWDRPCDNHDNFSIQLDDEAANSNWPCPPTDGLTYKPTNTLSFFDGKHSEGIWTLKIQDIADQDGGSLSTWGLKVCGSLDCQLTVNQTSGTGFGSLPAAITCAGVGDTIRLAGLLSGQTINIGSSPLLLDKNLVIKSEGSSINITGSGSRVFEIGNSAQVEFVDVKITAGTSMSGGAIKNPGIVKFKNVTIESNPSVPGASLITNTPGAQLFVAGTCNIHQ